jgi:hypothetical protein
MEKRRLGDWETGQKKPAAPPTMKCATGLFLSNQTTTRTTTLMKRLGCQTSGASVVRASWR